MLKRYNDLVKLSNENYNNYPNVTLSLVCKSYSNFLDKMPLRALVFSFMLIGFGFAPNSLLGQTCMIICPADVEVNTDAGVCIASGVELGTPIVTDCPGEISNDAPATFEVGSTIVTWTVQSNIEPVSCTMVVTVADEEAPEIICPANVTQDTDSGVCGAVVDFVEPMVMDNCTAFGAEVDLTFDFTGDVQEWEVPAGVTEIMVNLYGAEGGAYSGESLGGQGGQISATLAVTPGDILNIYVGGAGEIGGFLQSGNGAGGYNGGGSGGVLGEVLYGGGGGGGSDIRINGNTALDRVIIAGGGGGAGSSGDGGSGGGLMAGNNSDCSNGATQMNGGLQAANPGTDDGMGGSGASGQDDGGGGGGYWGGGAGCLSDVDEGGGGGSSYANPMLASDVIHAQGVRMGDGLVIISYSSLSLVSGLPSGSTFPVGQTVNTYVIADAAGNTAECSFSVTVEDMEAPVFLNCPPPSVTVDVFTNACVTSIFWDIPTATDNCDEDVTVTQTGDVMYGSEQPPGIYTITYTATDNADEPNTSECSFQIEVIDTENPVILNCPTAGFDISVDDNCEALLPDYTADILRDENCGPTTATQLPEPGTVMTAMDVLSVTIMVADTDGNSTSCTFDVRAIDDTAPTIMCPEDITMTNDEGECGAIVEYDDPVVADGCGLPTEEMMEVFNFDGSIQSYTVPEGVTELRITAVGAAGGGSTLEFINNITGQPGLGARMESSFIVTPGQLLNILVGGLGESSYAGGGGGGTYVWDANSNELLIAAGGGGGAGQSESGSFNDGVNASLEEGGTNGNGLVNGGGLAGMGGTAPTTISYASGGAGWLSNGSNGTNIFECIASTGGQRALLGGQGGQGGGNGGFTADGGFGGGGGGNGRCVVVGGGGGGGYSGGGAGGDNNARVYHGGGGGGSFSAGSDADNMVAADVSNGFVMISAITNTVSTLELVAGLPSGAFFPVGTTTNTYVVTDASGNTAECSFDVTVTDDEVPMITCPTDATISSTNLGTEGDCSGQYSWTVPVPTDNCAVVNYTVTYENPNGTIDGPQDAYVFTPQNDGNTAEGSELNVANRNFDVGVTTVTYYVEDASGNTNECSFTVTVTEDEDPEFINCPRPPVVVDAPEGWCSAFVNFALPLAIDNCGEPVVTQTDATGLTSGDIFPVGLTILEFTATDAAGNTTVCELKIIVNDYELPPTITCPADVSQENDPLRCGAVVEDIAPVVEDNCPDNTAVVYEVFDEEGNVVASGVEDASGTEFAVGTSTVTYTAYDQPILLITEVIQDGEVSGIEIGNIGPASMDITCASLIRITATDTVTFIVPNGVVVPVGGVYTHDFEGMIAADEETTYQFGFVGTILDSIRINDGILDGENVYRIDAVDHDEATDWAIANDCQPGSYEAYNPQLPVYSDNGTTSSLQSEPASSASCSFTVTVADTEVPVCVTQDTMSFPITGIAITEGMCITSMQTVGAGTVGEVRIRDLMATIDNVGSMTVLLESPLGTVITLFGGLCEGSTDIDMSLDDKAGSAVSAANCVALGNGGRYNPEEAFKAFYGEEAAGDWTLSIYTEGQVTGSLDSWILDVITNDSYAQMDTTMENDALVCEAEFTWIHPVFSDNCCEGSMSVTYEFSNDVTGETSITDPETILSESGFVDLDGTTTTRVFEVGTTVVRYTLIDAAGNESYCGFDVIVEDTEIPVFTETCEDIMIQLFPGECYGDLGSRYSATDNCGIARIYYTIGGEVVSSDAMPIGSNVVTQVVVDLYGNENMCDFVVEVIEYVPTDNTLVCIDNTNVSLGGDCTAVLDADMLLSGNDYGCYEDFCIVVLDSRGEEHANFFDITDAGETFEVSIVDCAGSGNSCWGEVNIEYKLVPDFECPENETISCNESTEPSSLGEPMLLSCVDGDVKTTYEDLVSHEDCETGIEAIITRIWTMTYKGGTTTCVQEITVEAFDVMEVEFPSDFFGEEALSCSAVAAKPALTTPEYTGEPNVNDQSLYGDSYCEINVGYWDETLYDVNCAGGYELLRHWIVRDECAPLQEGVNPMRHIQSIKVEDFTAPVIDSLADLTISTDLWGCGASFDLDSIIVTDNCTSREDLDVKVSVQGGSVSGNSVVLYEPARNRTFTVNVKATDQCKNTSFRSFSITVEDQVPPVVVADATDVVSLSSNGLAKVYADSFDDGSSDGCGPVQFKVRRMNGTCDGYEYEDGDVDSTEVDEDAWFDYVHFCCTDIQFDTSNVAIPVMVVFQVCDDANGDNEFGSKGDYCNTAMVEVVVQEKLPPVCTVPADMTLNCLDLVIYQDLLTGSILSDADAMRADVAFGIANADAACNADYSQELTSTDECNGKGEIIRKVIALNTINKLETSCTQIITIVTDTTNVLSCDDISFPADSKETKAGYDWCETNGSYIGDEQNEGANFPAIIVDNCEGAFITAPVIDINNLCSEVGMELTVDTFNFAGGGCKKILAHWEIIDQCQFEENYLYFNGTEYEINPFVAENGYFELYVEYDIFDTIAPVITCGVGQIVECGQELLGPISATAVDACTSDEFLSWTWRLDVNNDGSIDHNGEGSSIIPSDIEGLTEFPSGLHAVTWIVSDGCGNEATETCTFGFSKEDTKAPTPYCHDGLSSSVMLMNGVTLWASDFDAGSFDACSAEVTVTMVPEQDVEGQSDTAAYEASKELVLNTTSGEMEYGWNFDCTYIANGISDTIEMRVYATDDSGNWDYCVSSFRLQDNLGACEDVEAALMQLGGQIRTEEGDPVSGVSVDIMTTNPEFPKFTTSDDEGSYVFYNNPSTYNYEVGAEMDLDYRNGVTTLDLVLIQRHILGLELLESPYKLIAADINNDESIKASDLLQLRKLILGIYPEDRLPNNQSWRFVDKGYQFADTASPWPFSELLNVDNLVTDMMSEDFIGVKVGDVNSTAVANENMNVAKRNANKFNLVIDDKALEAGTVHEVKFRAEKRDLLTGYQFTLGFDTEALEYVGQQSGALVTNDDNYGLQSVSSGLISTSWDNSRSIEIDENTHMFSLFFKVKDAVKLSEVLEINSKITSAEAYLGEDLRSHEVGIEVRGGAESVLPFELKQNIPNPYNKQTVIEYVLPASNNVTFTISNTVGQQVVVRNIEGLQGINTLSIDRRAIDAPGVYYYTVRSGEYSATRKMIIVD